MLTLQPALDIAVRPLHGPDLSNGFLDVIRSFRDCDLSLAEAGVILRERIRRGVITLVADVGGRVVGTASLLIDHKFINNGGKAAIVEDVIVHPEFRGRGIGGQLLDAVVQKSSELGCYKVALYCDDELVPYYDRHGFKATDVFMRKNPNF